MDFVNVVRSLGVSKKHSQHNDDLFVDRLNHRYTVVILIIFSLVVTLSQYGGNPINCWVPGHFTGNYATYTDNICWVSSTYNIPLSEDLPNNESDRKTKLLKYYQWTPFILLFQALLFYFPRMIWRSLNDKSGLDIQSIVDAVYNCYSDQAKFADREKLLQYVTNSFDFYINSVKLPKGENGKVVFTAASKSMEQDEFGRARRRNVGAATAGDSNSQDELDDDDTHDEDENGIYEKKQQAESKAHKFSTAMRRFSKVFCITKGKRYGNYLLALFVFVKFAYAVNSLAQLFILNHFLGNDFLLLGFEVLSKIWYGDDWTQLTRFPRVTMCDFRIREVGIVHRYTVQCVLSINLFNEKIFIFLWFWLCLVSLFNVIDLFSWTWTLVLNTHDRYSYIRKRLSIVNTGSSSQDKALFKKFVSSYLREDVVLALRLLSRNSQDLIVSEIVANLYKSYKSKQREYNRHHYQLSPLMSGGGGGGGAKRGGEGLLDEQHFTKPKSIVVDETNNKA